MMVIDMKENIKMIKKKEKEYIILIMVINMMENLKMVGDMKVIRKMIKKMEKG